MAVSALAWKPDCGTVVVGTLLGSLELRDACLRRVSYGRTFDITCWTGSRATIRHVETGQDQHAADWLLDVIVACIPMVPDLPA